MFDNELTVKGAADKMEEMFTDLRSEWAAENTVCSRYVDNMVDALETQSDGSVEFEYCFDTEDPLEDDLAWLSERHPDLTFSMWYNNEDEEESGSSVWVAGRSTTQETGEGSYRCSVCSDYVPLVTGESCEFGQLCVDCLTQQPDLVGSMSLLICSPNPDTITTIRGHIGDHTDLLTLFTNPPALPQLLAAVADQEGLDFPTEFPAVNLTNREPHQLSLSGTTTEGGCVAVEYTTVRGDDGVGLWGDLSANHPDATFYFQLTQPQVVLSAHPVDMVTTTFVVANGARVMTNS